ncbi:MAG: nucleoside kinase, partial [Oscillospiraceae bacterium]
MKYKFEPKTGIEIGEIDKKLSCGRTFIDECEAQYEARVDNVADMIVKSACRAVMVSGPSASGKTTSANKLACALRRRGFQAAVVSLDDFFKNLEDYPLDEKGNPDLENVDAVDIQCVNDTLKQLFSVGRCTLPQFDFHTQHRKSEGVELVLDRSGYVIIEGIHALNPRLSESLPNESVFRLYVGLRTEYSQNGVRVLKTRDLRITRRMVRDYKFRGRDVAATL